MLATDPTQTGSAKAAYAEDLGNGLTLRTQRSEADVERIAEFHKSVFGPEVGPMMRRLLLRHPNMEWLDQVFVENAGGDVVSALCLIPWTWRYEDVELPVGEMGVVATAPDYRRQGLIRSQVRYFKERLAARGCLLSCIQGIPFYYRQFGYEYALPLEGGWRLELRQVPEAIDVNYSLRLATLDDLPVLQCLYAEAVQPLAIHTVRDEAIWRFLLEPYTTPDATSAQTWVVCGLDGAVEGYARLPIYHFGNELVVNEASRLRYGPAVALLQHCRSLATSANQPFIRLNLPAEHELVRLARALGAHDGNTYAWQIHIPDVAALLRALRPVLEARLATSLYAGMTRSIRLGFYRHGLVLRFEEGELVEVAELPTDERADASLPWFAFVPLLLGHRTLEELRTAYPDVSVHGEWRLLLSTLFPRTQAFIYTVY